MILHELKKGDNLGSIAQKYGTSVSDIARANGIEENGKLPEGHILVIESDNTLHRVKKGDSLYSIALKAGTSVDNILKLNRNLRPPYTIYPGDDIIVPDYAPKTEIDVNGYCYPNISDNSLDKALKSLTYLSIFSYNIMPDGRLKGIDDDRIIRKAREQNVAPFMVVTNIGDKGGFDSEITKSFLTDIEAVDSFINGIPDYLKQKGYLGLNVDFEYIYPENREDYNRFISGLSDRLSREGLMLSTALAPKTSDEQRGILYEGHDYKFLGEYCDWIALMTYEWGYIAGPPLAVAPRAEVEKVVRYSVTQIPPEKLLLGMPNYGYDWTLPYSKGTNAKTLSLDGAIDLALEVGAMVEYNLSSSAPFFTYKDGSGRDHIVWYDDARSISERLKLINEYGLLGASFWTINQHHAPTFTVLNQMFTINKVI